MAWLPAAPDDESGDWSVVELDPGETVDLTDGDWQVNANQMYAWAQSESGQNWDQFRSEPLNLVPEPEGQYQSAGLEVFNFTLH